MNVMQRGGDGQWYPAKPLDPQGWKAKCEVWCYDHGLPRIGAFFGRWDERGLGE